MRFDLELPSQHAASHRVAVLLINLGTPDAPTPRGRAQVSRAFLSDPRVVEIPALALAVDPAARDPAVSRPCFGEEIRRGLDAGRLAAARVHGKAGRGSCGACSQSNDYHVIVDYAMRYGTPGIPAMLNQLKLEGAERVLLVPMYPQYSSSTTATAFDDAFTALKRMRNQPEIRTIRQYADHPAYIGALAEQVHRILACITAGRISRPATSWC